MLRVLFWIGMVATVVTIIGSGISGFVRLDTPIPARDDTKPVPNEQQVVATVVTSPVHILAEDSSVSPEPFSRGYLTTPDELKRIRLLADQGVEPYRTGVKAIIGWANEPWDYDLREEHICISADRPRWIDNGRGAVRLYARAFAYHLTGEGRYAEEVREILERVMTEVMAISLESNQCRLSFAWGIPEVVGAADLIEEFWEGQECTGPLSTLNGDSEIGEGNCKRLFQNWLAKNPYYVISYSATAQSNWGAAATNTTAHIADYLWDRPEVQLHHRMPEQVNHGMELIMTPAEAYAYANKLMFDRMNGYGVEYSSSWSCDYLSGDQQDSELQAVKSQITENGIVVEDARREEHCNIEVYNGKYQNYPQLHIGNNIQQCELMLRRGDSSCYDNVELSDIPDYTFFDPRGERKTTHLRPGRGSLERAIKAIIVDSNTEWRHDSALAVAYRYYYDNHTLPGFEEWRSQLDTPISCDQDICFGLLTHGMPPGDVPWPVPVVPAP